MAVTSSYADLWGLDPSVTFLNHGSFGACPTAVLEVQQDWRARMERQPVHFFVRDLEKRLDAARAALAEFLGADPADLVFVPNATTGVNAVLRALRFAPGDELLTTNHGYNACRNSLAYAAASNGARVVVADVPFPLTSADQVVDAVMSSVTPRTRLALLDHITSPTALIWPIAQLAHALSGRGVETLIDGAHAPGMVPLSLRDLGVTYYAGNCHKWLCAPKGAGFLYVRRDRQPKVRPVVISHGANSPRSDRSRFLLEFDWTGTSDPSAYLSVPAAIQFVGELVQGGWAAVREHNHRLALAARGRLCEMLGTAPPCPDDMVGALAAIPISDGASAAAKSPLYLDPLQDQLLARYGIEIPVIPWPAPPHRLVRLSAQLYNVPEHYERLADALRNLLQ